ILSRRNAVERGSRVGTPRLDLTADRARVLGAIDGDAHHVDEIPLVKATPILLVAQVPDDGVRIPPGTGRPRCRPWWIGNESEDCEVVGTSAVRRSARTAVHGHGVTDSHIPACRRLTSEEDPVGSGVKRPPVHRTHRQLRPGGTHSLIHERDRYRVAQVLPVPGGGPQLTADSFGTRCLRFKWYVTAPACKARFRPVVSPCREGVEPSGLHRKVSIPTSDFLLSQVYPGATAKLPQLASATAAGLRRGDRLLRGR